MNPVSRLYGQLRIACRLRLLLVDRMPFQSKSISIRYAEQIDRGAFYMSFALKLSILVLALANAGCSSTVVLYENSGWLAHRWTSKLVDASADQRGAWRASFSQVMAEHRNRLLPEVIALLNALTVQARAGVSRDRLSCLVESTERLYREHAQLAVSLGTRVLADLSPEQIVHLAAKLEERNREYETDYLQGDRMERRKKRVARYVERIERWTGDLSHAQVAIVGQTVARMPETAAGWLAYRRQQQRHLIRLMQHGPSPAELENFLTAWWVHFAGRSVEFVQEIDRAREESIGLAVKLDAALTAAQRTTFLKRINDMREDLEGLSNKSLPFVDGSLAPTCV